MKGGTFVLIGLSCLVAVLEMGQLHPYGNPRTEAPRGRGTLMDGASMPTDVRAILRNKCADCHSAETRWPVYAKVGPGSWLLERDIMKGRQHMDLSRWAQLSAEQQETLCGEIAQQARTGKMPPLQYRLLHWGAKLSPKEVAELSMLEPIADVSAAIGSGDATRGKMIFEKRCMGCHALNLDREGPRLADVFGRRAGTVQGFEYSASLKKSGVIWDDANLERWLAGPDLMVPGTGMSVHVSRAQERKDLVAYLKSRAKKKDE